MITMLLGGMWHGASWNFIIWGGLHGMYLVIQNLFTSNYELKPKKLVKLVKVLFIYSVVSLTWVFFRSNDLDDSIYIIQNIFNLDGYSFSAVSEKFYVVKGAFLICILVILEAASFRVNALEYAKRSPLFLVLSMASLLVFISLFGTFESNSFIYFQF